MGGGYYIGYNGGATSLDSYSQGIYYVHMVGLYSCLGLSSRMQTLISVDEALSITTLLRGVRFLTISQDHTNPKIPMCPAGGTPVSFPQSDLDSSK